MRFSDQNLYVVCRRFCRKLFTFSQQSRYIKKVSYPFLANREIHVNSGGECKKCMLSKLFSYIKKIIKYM